MKVRLKRWLDKELVGNIDSLDQKVQLLSLKRHLLANYLWIVSLRSPTLDKEKLTIDMNYMIRGKAWTIRGETK